MRGTLTKGINTGQTQTGAGEIISTQGYREDVYERAFELLLGLVESCGGRSSEEKL